MSINIHFNFDCLKFIDHKPKITTVIGDIRNPFNYNQ